MFVDVFLIYRYRDGFGISARVETHFFKQRLHYGVQSSCAEVFAVFVFHGRDFRNLLDGVVGEFKFHPVDVQKFLVLFQNRVVGLRKDKFEILFGKVVKFHLNRKTSLQFGD